MNSKINELLSETTGREPIRENLLYGVLKDQGYSVELKHSVRAANRTTRQADLFIPSENVVIEVKDSEKVVDPMRPGTGGRSDESAYEQVRDYVFRLRNNLKQTLFYEDDPWLGAVTDGITWWIRQWSENFEQTIHSDQQPITIKNEYDFDKKIFSLFSSLNNLPWAPIDPTPEFEPFIHQIEEFYRSASVLKETVLQKKLWLKQLQLSGNHPKPSQEDALFQLHSLLILIARCIQCRFRNWETPNLSGFSSWLGNNSNLCHNIQAAVNKFNWVGRQIDLLRPIHNTLVETDHRKIFGEYYTPDWIAEAMVIETLDEEWLSEVVQIDPHSPNLNRSSPAVLDPACGSGTFLYHCAKRIVAYDQDSNNFLEPQRLANLVLHVIYGIDIHPVAVEMARTNLYRALPVPPTNAPQGFQCDSLMTVQHHSDVFKKDSVYFKNPPRNEFSISESLYLKDNFEEIVRSIVSCSLSNVQLPRWVMTNCSVEEKQEIATLKDSISTVIEEEGDGVWLEHIKNTAATIGLQRKNVNRIVGNPPWVANNKIQDLDRKSAIQEISKAREIWPGGRLNSSFDIATIFVDYCPVLYFKRLNEDQPNDLIMNRKGKCTWLLPYTAMRWETWGKFRAKHESQLSFIWDVHRLPFPNQSDACVLGLTYPSERAEVNTQRLEWKPKGDIPSGFLWLDVEAESSWSSVKVKYPVQKSDWYSKNKPIAKRGADFFPFVLIKIAEISHQSKHSIKFKSKSSKNGNWSQLGSLEGEISSKYIFPALFSNDVFPFVTSEGISGRIILPIRTKNNSFEYEQSENLGAFWEQVSNLWIQYRTNKSPPSLLENIDYLGKLSRQFDLFNSSDNNIVVYPTSGSNMCATIAPPRTFIDTSCYWIQASNEEEANFLTGLLNCDVLNKAFFECRTSNKHFHLNPWKKIPIPRFDANNESHRQIVTQAKLAKDIALATLREIPDGRQMDYKRTAIREELRNNGIQSKIDAAVQNILPDHTD